eukprot:scaffold338241_cov39-Attheya_sp.AAC.1
MYGVAVSWKIGKQPAVSAYSTDAELRAMFLAVKRTITFRHFLEHLGYSQAEPTCHHEDNQPSIDIVSANKEVTSRVQHIHIPVCYMHYHFDHGTFAPIFCKGTMMCAADICTQTRCSPSEAGIIQKSNCFNPKKKPGLQSRYTLAGGPDC